MQAHRLALLLLLGTLSTSASGEPCRSLDLAPLLAGVAPEIEAYGLPNGLRVFLAPRPGERSVSVRIAYDVGARDEATGRSGTAHLFEHLMFKGSERVPDGGVFRVVSSVGGRVNATTDYDTTQYWDTVPTAALPRVLFVEADRMRGLQVTGAKLENQRAAIREEGLSLEGIPYVEAAANFGIRLWRGTPYGHLPLGRDEDLAAMTLEEARRFHEVYYAPGNAVLVVAGGFAVAEARRQVERFFGDVPRGPRRPPPRPSQVDRRPIREVATDPLAPFPVYAMAWHSVGARDPSALALQVVDHLLMGHSDARLRRSVARRLALDAYSLPVFFRDVGLLNYVFVPRLSVDFETLRDAVRDEVMALRRDGPDDGEVCAGRLHVQRARLEALSTNEGVALAIAQGALFFGDPRAFERELHALGALDRAAIRAAIEGYLTPDFPTLRIEPTGFMNFVKSLFEWLPAGAGEALEERLL